MYSTYMHRYIHTYTYVFMIKCCQTAATCGSMRQTVHIEKQLD